MYDALRQRLSREHIAELIEHGRVEGQAYDVTERVRGGSLAELCVPSSDTTTIRRIVEEMSTALAAFLEVGLRHRALIRKRFFYALANHWILSSPDLSRVACPKPTWKSSRCSM